MATPPRCHQASQPRACTRQNISLLALLIFIHSLCHADAFLLPSHSPPTTHPSSSSLQPYLTTGTGSRTALAAKSGKKKNNKSKDTTITVNRIAYRNYEIVDTLEAGVALLGTEVKAIRDGKMNLRDGYIRPSKNGRSCVLHNVSILFWFQPFELFACIEEHLSAQLTQSISRHHYRILTHTITFHLYIFSVFTHGTVNPSHSITFHSIIQLSIQCNNDPIINRSILESIAWRALTFNTKKSDQGYYSCTRSRHGNSCSKPNSRA